MKIQVLFAIALTLSSAVAASPPYDETVSRGGLLSLSIASWRSVLTPALIFHRLLADDDNIIQS